MFARRALAPGLLAPASFNHRRHAIYGRDVRVRRRICSEQRRERDVGRNGRPAKPGDLIIAYGIGFGDVTPSILPGVMAEDL